MTDFDLVITGGTLVTAGESVAADLGVRDGRIAAVGQSLAGRETLDAAGRLVIPGGVDPHVHLNMPTGVTFSSDDWASGTRAAAHGGTTTVIDFVEPEPDQPLLAAFAARRAEADGAAVIDYGLHMTLADLTPARLAEVPDVYAAGMASFKTYTTYDFKLADAEFLAAMQAVADAGGMVITHCENDAIIAAATARLLAAGQTGPAAHPCSRPAAAEGEAVTRVLALAEAAGVPVYIVHVSTARGAAALAAAQARGQAAFGETCPQYLLLTAAEYDRPGFDGAKYVCSPPLRKQGDLAALWAALANFTLDAVGTDHCPFNFHGQKDLGREDFTQIPGGLPGIESRLALLYAFGVRTGRLSVNRWVEVTSTAPARIFGLYPRKGTLLPGADADIVIFDPDVTRPITAHALHERVDYTPYEALTLHGAPQTVLSRGRVLVRDGEFVGPATGQGLYLPRSL